MEQKEETKIKRRCSKCGSKFIYIRINTQEVVCRKCANIEKLEGKNG